MPYKPRSQYHNYIRRLCDEFRTIMFCGEYNLDVAVITKLSANNEIDPLSTAILGI